MNKEMKTLEEYADAMKNCENPHDLSKLYVEIAADY